MNRRILWIIGGIFIASGALLLFSLTRDKADTVVNKRCVRSCTSFELDSPLQQVKVSMRGGKWAVYYHERWFPGDKQKINNFLHDLTALKVYAQAGKTKDVWKSFGLDADVAVSLECHGLKCNEKIFFGKRVAKSPYIFIRKGTLPVTYEADYPSDALFEDSSYWMKLKIFTNTIIPKSVNALVFTGPSRGYEILRIMKNGQNLWKLLAPGGNSVLKNSSVHNLLEYIVNLKAEAPADVPAEAIQPLGQLNIRLSNGETHVVSFFKSRKTDNMLYFTADNSSQLYTGTPAVLTTVFPSYSRVLNTY